MLALTVFAATGSAVSMEGACIMKGDVIPNGEMGPSPWDSCNLCKCSNGVVTRKCTKNMCADDVAPPVSTVGSCVMGGDVIPNGAMGPSPWDSCNLCKCSDGVVTRKCTKNMCADEGPGAGSCVMKGEIVPNGQMGPSPYDSCNKCMCSNGKVTGCTYKMCIDKMFRSTDFGVSLDYCSSSLAQECKPCAPCIACIGNDSDECKKCEECTACTPFALCFVDDFCASDAEHVADSPICKHDDVCATEDAKICKQCLPCLACINNDDPACKECGQCKECSPFAMCYIEEMCASKEAKQCAACKPCMKCIGSESEDCEKECGMCTPCMPYSVCPQAHGDTSEEDSAATKDARGGEMRSPNPHGNTGCRSSFDCKGTGVYCYEGKFGRPNFCKEGSGLGSVCTTNASCGWIGNGDNARRMSCKSSRRRMPALESIVKDARNNNMKSPNPKPPPSNKYCRDTRHG